MSGVVPLDAKKSRIPRSQSALDRATREEIAAKRESAKSAAEAEADTVRDHLRALVEGRSRFEISDDGLRMEGRRVDLPHDALRRLRRGLLPVDARLDLHGMSAGEARRAVAAFVRTMHARGERCLLVVHGKGEHSPGGVGVLRGEIAAWLSQGAGSEHVAAFATATARDGGEGAIYVLLMRR
jgi:DNA-nicking Smr family endonuclease